MSPGPHTRAGHAEAVARQHEDNGVESCFVGGATFPKAQILLAALHWLLKTSGDLSWPRNLWFALARRFLGPVWVFARAVFLL